MDNLLIQPDNLTHHRTGGDGAFLDQARPPGIQSVVVSHRQERRRTPSHDFPTHLLQRFILPFVISKIGIMGSKACRIRMFFPSNGFWG
jgi:hypothetical protein